MEMVKKKLNIKVNVLNDVHCNINITNLCLDLKEHKLIKFRTLFLEKERSQKLTMTDRHVSKNSKIALQTCQNV